MGEAGFHALRKDLEDLLEGFDACAATEKITTIVRFTGECPEILVAA